MKNENHLDLKDSFHALRQDATAENEELLDFILNTTNIGYWEWDIIAGRQFLSSSFYRMLGYSEKEWQQEELSLEKVIQEKDLEKAREEFHKHVKSGGSYPYNVRVRYRHREGHWCTLWSRGKVVQYSDAKEPLLMRGTHMDITELTGYRQKLDEYSERLSLIVKGINAGIWDWDLGKDKVWLSARFYQLLGFVDAEFQANPPNFLDSIHPSDRILLETIVREHRNEEIPFKFEIRFITKDDGYRWFEVSGLSQLDKDGKSIRILGSIIDIHDRKTVEEEINRNQFLLSEAGKIAKAGAWEINMENMEVSWSDEVYAIHELEEKINPTMEISGQFYSDDSREKLRSIMEDAVKYNKAFDTESQFITAKNRHIWVRIAGYPVFDHQGKVKKIRGILQDIDDLKNKEIELQKSLDILAYQNKRLQNFAHIVSHNLRSHTGNIKMLLNFFERAEDEGSKSEVLKNIYKVSDQLDKTIYHLNEIVEEKVDLDKDLKQLSFAEILEQTLEVLEGSIRDQNVNINNNFEEAPRVNFIRPYLDSLFLNLLSNAIKYRHKDRDPIINVRSYRKNGEVKLEISDNGSGIDLDRYGNKVFGMYKTFHKNADARGLGLFLTKNQIEATGGSIEIESQVGQGTKFIITFRKQHQAGQG